MFIVHGLGEHCRRYDQLVGFLTAKLNFRVYSFDHRGHGRTLDTHPSSQRQGHRGHIHTDATAIMNDIELLIERADADGIEGSVPRFLLGHSLGGLFVASYAVERSLASLAGVILIGTRNRQLSNDFLMFLFLCIVSCRFSTGIGHCQSSKHLYPQARTSRSLAFPYRAG
jgi:pimeloyl-ACP methyl ester carboxylesterase